MHWQPQTKWEQSGKYLLYAWSPPSCLLYQKGSRELVQIKYQHAVHTMPGTREKKSLTWFNDNSSFFFSLCACGTHSVVIKIVNHIDDVISLRSEYSFFVVLLHFLISRIFCLFCSFSLTHSHQSTPYENDIILFEFFFRVCVCVCVCSRLVVTHSGREYNQFLGVFFSGYSLWNCMCCHVKEFALQFSSVVIR